MWTSVSPWYAGAEEVSYPVPLWLQRVCGVAPLNRFLYSSTCAVLYLNPHKGIPDRCSILQKWNE